MFAMTIAAARQDAETGSEEEEEEEEEDDMPVLKYHRMRAHLSTVLQGSGCQVTALAIHPRCLIVGTSKGTYVLLLGRQNVPAFDLTW